MVCSAFDPECLVESPNLCGGCYCCKEHCFCKRFHPWSDKLEDTAVWKNPEHQKIKVDLIKLFLKKWRQLCQKI